MADPAYIVDGVLTDGEAWVGIATNTVSGSDTALVTFASTDDGQVGDFSQYMDLVLISYSRSGNTNTTYKLTFNDDTGTNYARQYLYGDGSSATAASQTGLDYFDFQWVPPSSAGANEFGCSVTHLFDINSGKYKSGFSQIAGDQDGNGWVTLVTSIWESQAAITELDIRDWGGAAAIGDGSTFSLFGVLPRMVA